MNMESRSPRYDRQLLLAGAKRNTVLDLSEVLRYGAESWQDPDYVCLYGMRPADWYAKGIRIIGRTAVECTRDALADAMGRDIAAVAARAPDTSSALIVDPFTGSGNTLYWMLRHASNARGFGFELDPLVFQLTSQNLAALGLSGEVAHRDYRQGLHELKVAPGELLIAFIAPPWGDALNTSTGLDLRATTPPIGDIVDAFNAEFADNPLLFAIQIHETVNPHSMAPLLQRFAWSEQRLYRFNEPGQNHGLLIGTHRWVPQSQAPS